MLIIILVVVALFVMKGGSLLGNTNVQVKALIPPSSNPAGGQPGTTSNGTYQSVLATLAAGSVVADDIAGNIDKYS